MKLGNGEPPCFTFVARELLGGTLLKVLVWIEFKALKQAELVMPRGICV